MRTFNLFLAAMLLSISGIAQTRFFSSVKIEFERTFYGRQYLKEVDPDWYDQVKDQIPEKTLSYFDFIGDTTRSVYKPGREVSDAPRGFMGNPPANIVFTNYGQRSTISQRPVFEEVFLVQDSLRPIRWQMTADTRTIAGFECRKAIGIMDDTLAVFAFYTDEIMVTGGPESIHGLPGMILGLGFPRMHTTWFATKVEGTGVDLSKVKPETKGKKVTRKQMFEAINNAMKQWGDYGRRQFLQFVL